MVDRYTKVVLTAIAVCLLWLCVWGTGPHPWGTPAHADNFAERMYNAEQDAITRRIQLQTEADNHANAVANESAQKSAADLYRQNQLNQSLPETAYGTYGQPTEQKLAKVDIVAIGGRPIEITSLTYFDGPLAVRGLPVQIQSAGYP